MINKKVTVIVAAALLLAAFHFAASVSKMSDRFDDEPAAGPFGGIRLHYLKVMNFDFSHGVSAREGTSHILDNFVKSAVSGTHGLIDFAHWYAYSGLYDLLGIPVNEFWLLVAQTAVMLTGLLLTAYLMSRLYGIAASAVFFAVASQVYVQHSISFYIVPVNTLYEALLLIAMYKYDWQKGGIRGQIPLLAMLLVNSACGNVIKLPVYMYFAWALGCRRWRPVNLLLVLPVCAAVAGHLYVYSRIGGSNLGLIGWVSQKVGLGTPLVYKIASAGNTLKSFVSSGVWGWWAPVILALFYVIATARSKGRRALLLFPFIYYAYLVNIEPYSAMLPYLMIAGISVAQMFLMSKDRPGKPLAVYATAVFAVYLFAAPASANLKALVLPKKPDSNYLKSTGYYLREHMGKEDRIASLLDQRQNILNEYYYGKNFFKSPVFGKYIYDMRNLTEPLSASNPVAAGEAGGEFPFYVVSAESYAKDKGYASYVDGTVAKYSLKKVADIYGNGVDYVSVYSSRPLGYTKLEVSKANREFDRKYANLKKLFYNRHVGVASTWGFY